MARNDYVGTDGTINLDKIFNNIDGNTSSLADIIQQNLKSHVLVNAIFFGADITGITDSSAAVRAALDTGNEVYVPKGVTLAKIIFKDGDRLRGAGIDQTFIKFIDNNIGEGFWDNGIPVNVQISDLTLVRKGTGVTIVGAGQNNRYCLHVTGVGSIFRLQNVKLTDENWDLGADRQTDWAGLIMIVNEQGTVVCDECEILTRGRGIYQPDMGVDQYTRWNGYLYSEHKAVSLHRGLIQGKGDIKSNIPDTGTVACLSNYAGTLEWLGNIDFTGYGQAIYNALTADIYVHGKINAKIGYGVLNAGTSSVRFDGELTSANIGVQTTGAGKTVINSNVVTTGIGIVSGGYAHGVNATNGTTIINGKLEPNAEGIRIDGGANSPTVEMNGDINILTANPALDFVSAGTIRLNGSRVVCGGDAIDFAGTGVKVADLRNCSLITTFNTARRSASFGATTNALLILQDVRMICNVGATECIKTNAANTQNIKIYSAFSNKPLGTDINNAITGTALIVDADITE